MNPQHEDRIADLIEKFDDHSPEEFLSGKMLREWAVMCLEHEMEERDAVVAFLMHAQVPKAIVEMVRRGAHRKRSTGAMEDLKKSRAISTTSRDSLVKEYVRS